MLCKHTFVCVSSLCKHKQFSFSTIVFVDWNMNCVETNPNNIGNMMKMIVTENIGNTIGAIVFSAQLHPNGQAQAILRDVSDTHPTTGN